MNDDHLGAAAKLITAVVIEFSSKGCLCLVLRHSLVRYPGNVWQFSTECWRVAFAFGCHIVNFRSCWCHMCWYFRCTNVPLVIMNCL